MKQMTLMQHFSELRRRILWIALIFAVAFGIGWCMAPYFQDVLARPLLDVWPDGRFIYTGLADGLMIQFSLAGLFAMIVVLPGVLWHVWAFVGPGLKKNEKNFIWPILLMSPILFIMGAAFAFWGMFPIAFKFFIDLNQTAPVPSVVLPVARDYLAFAIGLMKVFGIAFQLPLALVILNRIGLLARENVIKMRRYAIVVIVLVAAILTPPDVVSQILLAVPMWLLFEISILFMRR